MEKKTEKKMSSSRKFRYYLEYMIFRGIETMIILIPRFLILPFAKFIAFLIYRVLKFRRSVTLSNLAIAFPEKTVEERDAIGYGSYVHFSLLILEFMKLSGWQPEDLEKKFTIDVSDGVIERFESATENGAVLVSGHLGNWEMAAAAVGSQYLDSITGIIKRQHNRYIDHYLINSRKRWSIRLVYSRGAIKSCLEALSRKQVVGLLCDQDGGKKGTFVPFFGKMSATPIGAALLSLKTRAPLYFFVCFRTGNFKYQAFLVPVPYDGEYDPTPENIQKLTTDFTAVLEKYIRLHPEQYLWMHKRWKTPYNPSKDD